MSRTKATKKELAADAAKAMLDQSVAGWGSDASAPTAAGPKDASRTTVKDAAGDAGQEAGKSAAGNAAKKAGTGARRTVRKKTVKADPKADSKDEPKAGPKDEKAAEPKTAGESDKPAEPTAGRSAPAPAPKTEPSVERAQDKPASASEPAKETKPSDDSAGDDLEAPPKREPVIDKLSLLPEEIAAKGNPARDRMEWDRGGAKSKKSVLKRTELLPINPIKGIKNDPKNARIEDQDDVCGPYRRSFCGRDLDRCRLDFHR